MAEGFFYRGFDIDPRTGVVICRYALDDRNFEERISLGSDGDWSHPAATEAARLVALLAGVSYYKAGAPPLIDLAEMPTRPGEIDFLRRFYLDGLGEFAYRNGLVLDDVKVIGGVPATAITAPKLDTDRPLIPFGGGLDSIVTVELVRSRHPDTALFVVSREGDRFDAIERAAAVTGLPVVRATRQLDAEILRSHEHDFLNGHVPVTGIISAIAVLAAVVHHRGAVVMSNEWSASSATLTVRGRAINHQYSKSMAFEEAFRSVVGAALGGSVEYFSALRPFSELWIAERFAALRRYHPVFHSCNRAFHIDPARRQRSWCGECDKCCFVDLILSPFLAPSELDGVFDGHEPLTNPMLIDRFRTLIDVDGATKPFECVGDTDECRAAVSLAARRPDRAGNTTLATLASETSGDIDIDRLFQPIGAHHIPDAYFPAAALG
ncbi:MAG: hypothetical protein ACYDH6_01870 [Acidimicrobiales bacterium]